MGIPSASPKSNWPTLAMTGYVDATVTGAVAAITASQVATYNVIIIGFAQADGTVSPGTVKTIQHIQSLQSPGSLTLLSTGGANGHLDLNPQSAKNLADAVHQNNLSGIDLDLEEAGVDVEKLSSFVSDLRLQLANDKCITAAPILAGTSDHPTLNIPNGGPSLEPLYSKIPLDALLVQAYNSGTNFHYPVPGKAGQMVGENSPSIIAAAYDALQKKGGILDSTQIVIGIPANPGAAPTASNLWNNHSLQDSVRQIKANLDEINEGKNGIEPRAFGGLMQWSLNADAMPDAFPPLSGATANGPPGFFAENVATLIRVDRLGSVQSTEPIQRPA